MPFPGGTGRGWDGVESEAGKGCPGYILEVTQESTGSHGYYFGLDLHFHSTPVSPCLKYCKDFLRQTELRVKDAWAANISTLPLSNL